MSVSLDIRTILFISMLANVVLALVMLVYWRIMKPYAGFGFMILSNASFALTFLFFAFRGVIPEFYSIVGANLLAVLSAAFRLEGIRHFIGALKIIRGNFVFAVIFAFILAFVSGVLANADNGLYIRTILISVVIMYFAGSIAWTTLTAKDQHARFLFRIIAIFHIGYCLLLALRSFVWIIYPEERNLFAPTFFNLGFFIYDLINHIGITVLFLILNGQRLETHLNAAQKNLELLATCDSLTGLYNNRTFYGMGRSELLRSRRSGHAMSLLMFDLDYFKNVNDSFGHVAGDYVLTHVGRITEQTSRSTDIIARMGGDEFAIILPETPIELAKKAAERLFDSISSEPCEWESKKIRLSLSIGVTSMSPDDPDFDTLLRRADDALYQAKRSGRNQIVFL